MIIVCSNRFVGTRQKGLGISSIQVPRAGGSRSLKFPLPETLKWELRFIRRALHIFQRTASSTCLGELDESSTAHVALHDGLEHSSVLPLPFNGLKLPFYESVRSSRKIADDGIFDNVVW